MKKETRYSAPEIDYLPLSYQEVLCGSVNEGSTEDYDLVEGFEW